MAFEATLGVYVVWKAARIALKQDCSKVNWSLVAHSAKQWISNEVEDMEASADRWKEVQHVRIVESLERYFGKYWAGSSVDDYVPK